MARIAVSLRDGLARACGAKAADGRPYTAVRRIIAISSVTVATTGRRYGWRCGFADSRAARARPYGGAVRYERDDVDIVPYGAY